MSSASPTSITNDCTKIAVEYSYHVGIGKGTAATFHGTHEDRFRTSEADVYFGELKDGKWEFKLILASKQWLSHTQIEPVKGDRIIVYKDGPAQLVPESCYVMNTDGSDFHKVAEIPSNGMARLCQWMGDGKHILFKYLNMPSNQWGYMLADAYEKKVVGKVILPFEYNKLFHEIAPKMLKNGNVGAVGDAQEGTVYYAEFDFKAEKLVRWAKIAKYGERYLPGADEVWFPHPNISQDKKFVAFTSSNGQGKKGSDVFVVSGLPE